MLTANNRCFYVNGAKHAFLCLYFRSVVGGVMKMMPSFSHPSLIANAPLADQLGLPQRELKKNGGRGEMHFQTTQRSARTWPTKIWDFARESGNAIQA